jgi:hypothetical protein
MLRFHTCTSEQKKGDIYDRSTSKAKNQEGNVPISHLHEQTKGGKHAIDQHA